MKIRRPEIFFAVVCLITGVLWNIISEWRLSVSFQRDSTLTRSDLVYDMVFVLLISLGVFIAIRFYRKQWQDSVSHYKTLFNTSPLPMWIFDIDTEKFLLVNQAMVEKYGYTRKELKAMSPVDIRPAEEVEKFLHDIHLRKSGVQDVGIWKHKKKDGTVFHVRVRTNKIMFRGKECFLVIADDISDLIEKETEIQRLSLVAEHTVNGIIITGTGRKIEWVNEAFINMTGYSFEEALGKMPIELLHGPDTDKQQEWMMKENIVKGEYYSGEVLNYRKDGTPFWVQTTVSPIEIEGKAEKHVAIFVDITERKMHEQQISQQNNALRDIAFASSHVVRAPLANIIGLTDLLKDAPVAEHGKIIEHLQTSSQRLDSAVKEMVRQSVDVSNNFPSA